MREDMSKVVIERPRRGHSRDACADWRRRRVVQIEIRRRDRAGLRSLCWSANRVAMLER